MMLCGLGIVPAEGGGVSLGEGSYLEIEPFPGQMRRENLTDGPLYRFVDSGQIQPLFDAVEGRHGHKGIGVILLRQVADSLGGGPAGCAEHLNILPKTAVQDEPAEAGVDGSEVGIDLILLNGLALEFPDVQQLVANLMGHYAQHRLIVATVLLPDGDENALGIVIVIQLDMPSRIGGH